MQRRNQECLGNPLPSETGTSSFDQGLQAFRCSQQFQQDLTQLRADQAARQDSAELSPEARGVKNPDKNPGATTGGLVGLLSGLEGWGQLNQ